MLIFVRMTWNAPDVVVYSFQCHSCVLVESIQDPNFSLGIQNKVGIIWLRLCTEVRFAIFLSRGFTSMAVINQPERKLAKRTSVLWQCQAAKLSCKRQKQMISF